ncbi:hypothetical protein, partial [uncultured Gammaproteobacteria bacterium]
CFLKEQQEIKVKMRGANLKHLVWQKMVINLQEAKKNLRLCRHQKNL